MGRLLWPHGLAATESGRDDDVMWIQFVTVLYLLYVVLTTDELSD